MEFLPLSGQKVVSYIALTLQHGKTEQALQFRI